ncbi:hypothetical protein E6H33_04385 [Candidatus Bathyarchaeota archaeon]|nr:MAG: hypothetical protein E6H33_04385 [Candidatus Bathyarchaeota archaeon]
MERKNILGLRTLLALFGLASIIALATGFLPLTDTPSPGGEWQAFGLPFPWKGYDRGCPPPCLQTGTNYAWPFFALDVVIYAIIGYGLVQVLSKKPGRELLLKKQLESGKIVIFLLTMNIVLFTGNLAYDFLFGWGPIHLFG